MREAAADDGGADEETQSGVKRLLDVLRGGPAAFSSMASACGGSGVGVFAFLGCGCGGARRGRMIRIRRLGASGRRHA